MLLGVNNAFKLLHVFLIFWKLYFFNRSQALSAFFNCLYFLLEFGDLFHQLFIILLFLLNFWKIVCALFILFSRCVLESFNIFINLSYLSFIKVDNLFSLLYLIFIISKSLIFRFVPFFSFFYGIPDHLILLLYTFIFISHLYIFICLIWAKFLSYYFGLYSVILPLSLNPFNLQLFLSFNLNINFCYFNRKFVFYIGIFMVFLVLF